MVIYVDIGPAVLIPALTAEEEEEEVRATG